LKEIHFPSLWKSESDATFESNKKICIFIIVFVEAEILSWLVKGASISLQSLLVEWELMFILKDLMI
jgi:hypothetical protein